MKLYVVTMYRYGNTEGHSYVEGVYTKESWAKENGEAERIRRDNKYEPQIKTLQINESQLSRQEKAQKLAKRPSLVRASINKKVRKGKIKKKFLIT